MADRFLDRTITSGNLTGTWDWTQDSDAVTAVAASGDAINDGLEAGDFIKPATKNEWYPVLTVTDKDNLVLDYDYIQATSGGETVPWSDVSDKDGTAVGKAFVHINQYSTREVRSAGDQLHSRRAQTHLHEAKQIDFDESGAIGNHIEIIADDGTHWGGEGGLADPIFNFNDSALGWFAPDRLYWKYKDLELKESGYTYGNCPITGSYNWFENIKSTLSGSWGGMWCWGSGGGNYFKSCTLLDNGATNFTFYTATGGNRLVDCVFEAGVVEASSYGIRFYAMAHGTYQRIENCTFGVVNEHTVADIQAVNAGDNAIADFINCNMASTTLLASGTNLGAASDIRFHDYDATKNKAIAFRMGGAIIERITGTVRSGGADTSIEVTPSAKVDDDPDIWPFIPYEAWVYNADEEKTYEIWMQATGTWAALPNASELYIEASYFDDAGAGRTTMVSDEVISSEDTWTKFELPAVNPTGVGPIRIRVYLKKYESGKKILIDPLVVIT